MYMEVPRPRLEGSDVEIILEFDNGCSVDLHKGYHCIDLPYPFDIFECDQP